MTLEERKDNTYYDKTGILKDLMELKRYDYVWSKTPIEEYKNGRLVLWSDVEAIINKYSHP